MEFLRKIVNKKLVLGIFVGALLFTPLFSTAKAAFVQDAGMQPATPNTNDSFWYKASQSVNAGGTDIISWIGWTLPSIEFHLTASILGYPEADGKIPPQAIENSAIGRTAGLIRTLYESKPSSSIEYLASLKESIGLGVKPAYAQGQGWQLLESPVLELWQITRNVSYLFFVVMFVFIGFLIMFRKKIDPQTVIGIQTALPKIAVALILVTFSYAIAGLLIDVAFLGNRLMDTIFLNQPLIQRFIVAPGGVIPPALAPLNLFGLVAPAGHTYLKTARLVSVDPLTLVGFFLGGGGVGSIWSMLTASPTMGLIFTVVVLTSAIRIFLALLSKYVTLIVSTIFAPLSFLWGSLPGQEDHLSKWFRSFLSAVLTFPAMYLLLNLASYFLIAGNAYALRLDSLEPLNLGAGALSPTGTGSGAQVAGQLLAIGIIIMLPSLPSVIDDALQVKPSAGGEQLGAGIGGALRRIPFVGSIAG